MRLTIAIPTVNRDYCIRRAVDSALRQTSRDVEILVSNNGSTDSTAEILESYSDARLRVYHHATTMPITDHGNFLMDQATGDLFVGLSDDDYLEPEFADKVLASFRRAPQVSFVYTRCWTHVRDAQLPSPAAPELEDTVEFFENYFAGRRHLFWCACVTRTADLRRLGGLPPGVMIGDMYFWTQLAFEGPVGCVSDLLSHYTYLVDNVSVGIPVCRWAHETRVLIERISTRLGGIAIAADRRQALSALMSRYLARTTANQFALNASRGASKTALLGALLSCGRLLRSDVLTVAPRILASLLLPSFIMRRVVARFAMSRSRWARGTRARGGEPSPN